MSVRPIIVLPDPQLRLVSRPVTVVDASIRALMEDMLETMYDAPGIGLAAIQIGVPTRVIVLDVAKGEEAPAPLRLVNPEIVWSSPETRSQEEGCLSIPDIYEEIERPARIRVRFLDQDGAACEMEAEGLLATCIQHEIDHTDGILFIDRLSRLKRERIVKKARKAVRRGAEDAPRDTPEA
ncbi:MAG TPA: peptide deformylase [Beijerinckiaceae bacterium]|nr:peptide deformylase [Beijerinckiaceae bacterium]